MDEKLSLIKKIGNFISNILLGETKEIIVRTDEKVRLISKTVDSISVAVDNFRSSIATHGANIEALQIHTRYGVSHSPTVPNEKGQEILEKSGFSKQYPILKSKIFTLMDTMNLRTLYDYENGAFETLTTLKNDPEMDILKEYVVNNPNYPLDAIFKVASWVIRDDYDIYKKKS
ncbi:MAG: hypothetical protein WAN61_01360 [Minisyncoccia bacterium]